MTEPKAAAYKQPATSRIPWRRFPWVSLGLPSAGWTGVWLWTHLVRAVILLWVVDAVAVGFFAIGAWAATREADHAS